MSSEWDGKVALVTGAGGGIGRQVVAGLLADGAAVVAFDALAEPLEAARAEWAAGDRVHTAVGDVGDPAAVAAAFAAPERLGGPLGALVACAGIYPQGALETLSDAEGQRVERVNRRGVFVSCHP